MLFKICWKLIASKLIIKNDKQYNNNHNNKNLIKNLTKCATCNLYLPMEDAIHCDGKIFCCQAHADQKI